MAALNPQAQALNDILKNESPFVYRLLSEKGRRIFYPQKGMLQQGVDAKGKKINATIGMAVEDDRSPMRLHVLSDCIPLDPKDVFPYAPSIGLADLRKSGIKYFRPVCRNRQTGASRAAGGNKRYFI